MPAGMAKLACMFADSILLRNAGRKYVLNMNNCQIPRLKMPHLARQFPGRSSFHFRPHNGHRKNLNETRSSLSVSPHALENKNSGVALKKSRRL